MSLFATNTPPSARAEELPQEIPSFLSYCQKFVENVSQRQIVPDKGTLNLMISKASQYREEVADQDVKDELQRCITLLLVTKTLLGGFDELNTPTNFPDSLPSLLTAASMYDFQENAKNLHITGADRRRYDSTLNIDSDCSLLPECDSPRVFKRESESSSSYNIEDLIEQVKESPFLYDKFHPMFKDSKAKDKRWTEIASRYNMAGSSAIKKWTHIRDRYKRILNEVILHKERGEVYMSNWKYFDDLHAMLFRNYESMFRAKTGLQLSPLPCSPKSADVTTINFSNASQLLSSTLRHTGDQETLNRPNDSGEFIVPTDNPTREDDHDIVACDFLVAEQHIGSENLDSKLVHKTSSQDEGTNLLSKTEQSKSLSDQRVDLPGDSPSSSCLPSTSIRDNKENVRPLKRSAVEPYRGSPDYSGTTLKRKKSGSSDFESDNDEDRDFIDHFVRYVGGRIRSFDEQKVPRVMLLIHETLFKVEMENQQKTTNDPSRR